jgi:hypothetical protein
MAAGVVKNIEGVTRCGVMCDGWPTWAIGAHRRGYQLVVILMRSENWLNRVKSLFPGVQVVLATTGEAWKDWAVSYEVDCWLSDLEPPRSLGLFVRYPAAAIVTRRRVRYNVINTHFYQYFPISHADCGGVTDGVWDVHVYLPTGAERLGQMLKQAGRDLCSVVNSKLGGVPCQPPGKITSLRPGVTRVRPGTYHVNGLYPLNETVCRLVVPSVFSPTDWVRRKLSGEEMCAVLDIPEEFSSRLNSKEIAKVCRNKVFPLKVASHVLDQLDLSWYNKPAPQAAAASAKRMKADNVEGELMVAQVADCGIPEAGLTLQMEEARKLKATKADDAQVPEHLWDSVLVPCGDIKKIGVLAVFRKFALRWVKRNTTRDFLRWFFVKHPVVRRMFQMGNDFSYQAWASVLQQWLGGNKEGKANWEAGRECIARYSNSSWWEWGDGS